MRGKLRSVGTHMKFQGALLFSSVEMLERGKQILSAHPGSLVESSGCKQHHLALVFDIDTGAPSACWDDTWGAMYELERLGDVRGHVSGQYGEDLSEGFQFVRRVEAPSLHRGSSSWWTRLRPPPPPPDFRARYDASTVHTIYALTSESEHDGPHCPSFVVGPLPEGIVWDGGPWDAFAGLTYALEQELDEQITKQRDPEILTALTEALAWVQARSESHMLQVQEPPEYAGDGTARPRVFGKIEPGFAEDDDPASEQQCPAGS